MKDGHPMRRNAGVLVLLLLLLVATLGSAYVPLGNWNAAINLGIAFAKALLVAVYFMHLCQSGALVRLAAVAALFIFIPMFGLAAMDYLVRDAGNVPWQGATRPHPPERRSQ